MCAGLGFATEPRRVRGTFDTGKGVIRYFSPKFVYIFFYIDTGQKGLRCDAMRLSRACFALDSNILRVDVGKAWVPRDSGSTGRFP